MIFGSSLEKQNGNMVVFWVIFGKELKWAGSLWELNDISISHYINEFAYFKCQQTRLPIARDFFKCKIISIWQMTNNLSSWIWSECVYMRRQPKAPGIFACNPCIHSACSMCPSTVAAYTCSVKTRSKLILCFCSVQISSVLYRNSNSKCLAAYDDDDDDGIKRFQLGKMHTHTHTHSPFT